MSHLIGINDMKQFALPAGWDAGELEKYRLAEGTTYDDLLSDIAAALQMKTQELNGHPQYGTLLSFTSEQAFEYRQGTGQTGMEERTEYRTGDGRRGATVGHQLPLKSFDRVLGWTWDFLRKARRRQIDADIMSAMYDVEDEFQRRALTRFFSDADNQLATSGYDLALANASSNVAYIPPAYNGKTFASSHTHFARDTTANRVVAIKAGVLSLREHGIMGPWLGIVPQAQVATYTALSNFVEPDRDLKHFMGSSDVITGGIDEQVFFGALKTDHGLIFLWETPRITTDHFGLYKFYGRDDARNPVAVRYSTDLGAGPLLLPGEQQPRAFPLEHVVMIHEYGCGIQGEQNLARLNGYCIYFNSSGDYVVPTVN